MKTTNNIIIFNLWMVAGTNLHILFDYTTCLYNPPGFNVNIYRFNWQQISNTFSSKKLSS